MLGLATSCLRSPVAPSGGTVLVTDRNRYSATYESGADTYRIYGFSVVAQFLNATDAPVYLARCYPTSPHPIYGVVTISGDPAPISGYDPNYACVGHDQQVVVAPGALRTDTLHLTGPNAFDGITKQPYGVLAGQMRLLYQVSACPGDGGCAGTSPARQLSNTFEVVQAP